MSSGERMGREVQAYLITSKIDPKMRGVILAENHDPSCTCEHFIYQPLVIECDEPQTVREVVEFGYIKSMSVRQINNLMHRTHKRVQELEAEVARLQSIANGV